MKIRFTALLIALLIFLGFGKEPRPDNSNWSVESLTLFYINKSGQKIFAEAPLKENEDAILESIVIRDSFLSEIFKNAQYSKEQLLWKLSFPAVLTFHDGTEKELRISSYGGFFKVEGYSGNFIVSKAQQAKWEEILHPQKTEALPVVPG